MRVRSKFTAGIATLAAALLGGATAPAPQTPLGDAALRARHALPASRFVEIQGQTIHYVDEGRGPAIVLLHGSFGSLLQWNGWANTLKRHYRVVRLDLPPAGLSGPAPDGDYGVARKQAIVDALTRKLGIERFVLVATSSGAITGTAFAAEHPERLLGFVYSNASVGKVIFDTAHFSPALKAAVADDATHKGYHLPEYWRQILLLNFANPAKVTPALVRQWTELNNRALEPRFAPAPGSVPGSHERAAAELAAITVPTLVLWSADDGEATLARDGRRAFDLLGTREKTLAVVPHCGHMIALDCSDESVAAATPFFETVTRARR